MGLLEKICLLFFFIIIYVSGNESSMEETLPLPRRGLVLNNMVSTQKPSHGGMGGPAGAAAPGEAAGGGGGGEGEGEGGPSERIGAALIVVPIIVAAHSRFNRTSNAPRDGTGGVPAAAAITGSILASLVWM
ncbi:hypothetical protein Sjap_012420 [Stephania japonica]|uniref:Uncharacterized protein n=1 Tax=Stephania japonica TaxID=461633 RepID=A0AAP0IW16_9MAGN